MVRVQRRIPRTEASLALLPRFVPFSEVAPTDLEAAGWQAGPGTGWPCQGTASASRDFHHKLYYCL